VVAVGAGARDNSGNLLPMVITVGDKVLYGKWGGTEVKIEGHQVVIMKENDILGIIE
jgi:chaperonin GroES